MTREEARKAAEVMLAYANGEEIEIVYSNSSHQTVTNPEFNWGKVEYRVKPKPTYRPFKDKEECWNEMNKHQPFGWVKSKNSGSLFVISLVFWDKDFNDVFVTFGCGESHSSKIVLNEFTFADGTPFGIKEE